MSKYRNVLIGAALASMLATGPALAQKYGIGRLATDAEIAAWDKDVLPDGTGLPVGSGNAYDGEEIFADYCAICHGDFAEGVDNWPKLAGGMDTLDHEDPLKTVGSYWPYLSTTWDYVNRSMPFGNAQTLTPDQVYAIVAYILYSNDLVDEDFELSNENFLDVEMPNSAGFIVDDRRDTEYGLFTEANACMTDCKESVEITMRAAVLDVTPEETRAKKVLELVRQTKPVPVDTTTKVAAAETPAAEAPAEEAAVEAAAVDPELVKAGEKAFKKCKACHQVGEKAKNKTGPHLNNVFGRPLGGIDGFKYSKTMAKMGDEGTVWNDETLTAFLAKPKSYVKKTKMSFAGFKKDGDIEAVLAYLRTFQE